MILYHRTLSCKTFTNRHFYIDLQPEEQALISQLVMSENPRNLFMDYFCDLSENAAIKREKIENLMDSKKIDFSSAEGAAQFISVAKEGGMYIPLKVTILVKNFLALNKMCRDSGFASVKEVMMG